MKQQPEKADWAAAARRSLGSLGHPPSGARRPFHKRNGSQVGATDVATEIISDITALSLK